ncbi:MAG: hypothetical protein M0Q21_05635 [Ignavibacteriaceae bacterium]|nr:hypothetical protein [Ignavibacteriaceae bacterium]
MFTILDKSNYLRGLLIVAKMNNKIDEGEKDIISSASNRFGFSQDFLTETMQNILANDFVSNTPIQFSKPAVAQEFIGECLKLIISKDDPSPRELLWLNEVAKINTLDDEWFIKEKRLAQQQKQ